MRGQRVTLPARKAKLDLLITSARYHSESGSLELAKGFEPVGQVWSDILIFRREELVDRLQAGDRVVRGEKEPLVADFEPKTDIRLVERDKGDVIQAKGVDSEGDDLGVPIL